MMVNSQIIYRSPSTQGGSPATNQNFVVRSDNIYVMDNHRAALWCWLQHVDIKQSYNLVHIDRHYDNGGPHTLQWDQALNGRKLENLTLNEYLCAEGNFDPTGGSSLSPAFRYDNYLTALECYFPSVLGRSYLATHGAGILQLECSFQAVRADELVCNIDWWLSEDGFGSEKKA